MFIADPTEYFTVNGGESSSQFRWFTIAKIEQYIIFDVFCFNFGTAVAKIFNKYEKISPEKSFSKLWVWFFPPKPVL